MLRESGGTLSIFGHRVTFVPLSSPHFRDVDLKSLSSQPSCLSCQAGVLDRSGLLMAQQTNLTAKIQDFVLKQRAEAAVGC